MKKLATLFLFASLTAFAQSAMPTNKVFTEADSLRGKLSALRTCYDVLAYDLNIRVDIDEKFIDGSNTIRFKAISKFNCLQIDLFENMKISAIMFHGDTLAFDRKYNAVFVNFVNYVEKGVEDSIIVFYSGNPRPAVHAPWDGGFSWKEDDEGNPWIGVSCQHLGASCWWPCKDHQSDEPEEMNIRVSVPSSLNVIANGRLKDEQKMPGNFTQYHWYVSSPINTYCVSINIGKYEKIIDRYSNSAYKQNLSLDYYVLPNNVRKAKRHFKQVKPMLDAYYHYFGEYPFMKDGYKLVETPYLGMEHQGCIAYGNKYKKGYLGKDLSKSGFKFDYIIIHETAHEWWGNSVTTNDIADMWIHEGFGTYTEALYVEYLHGHKGYLKYINSKKRSVGNKETIIGQYDVNNVGAGDMYNKGALLIHTIRYVVNNDSLFFAIIKEIQTVYKHKTVNSSDIEWLFSKRSGMDLKPIFNQYLRATTIPTFVFKLEQQGDNLKISYKYDDVDDFTMPIKVTTAKKQLSFISPSNEWSTKIISSMKQKDFKVATDLFYINVREE